VGILDLKIITDALGRGGSLDALLVKIAVVFYRIKSGPKDFGSKLLNWNNLMADLPFQG
jgi:hypothetical protein